MKTMLVVLFLLPGFQEEKKSSDWKEFTSKEGRFKVLMPDTPKQRENETESDFGKGTLIMETVEHAGGMFGANYCDYPADIKKHSADRVLDSSRQENQARRPSGPGHSGRSRRQAHLSRPRLFSRATALSGRRLRPQRPGHLPRRAKISRLVRARRREGKEVNLCFETQCRSLVRELVFPPSSSRLRILATMRMPCRGCCSSWEGFEKSDLTRGHI
jgi:hypothetical protein